MFSNHNLSVFVTESSIGTIVHTLRPNDRSNHPERIFNFHLEGTKKIGFSFKFLQQGQVAALTHLRSNWTKDWSLLRLLLDHLDSCFFIEELAQNVAGFRGGYECVHEPKDSQWNDSFGCRESLRGTFRQDKRQRSHQ